MNHEGKKYTIVLNGDESTIPMDIIEVRLRLNTLKRTERDKRVTQLFIPAMTVLVDTIERDLGKKFPNIDDIDQWMVVHGYTNEDVTPVHEESIEYLSSSC